MSATLIVARDPGAASCLVPVARQCGASVIGLDHARPVFERAGIHMKGPDTDADVATAALWLAQLAPEVLLTGTSRLDLVPRDAAWWTAARNAGIPSVALLDHWIGYWQKFTVAAPFDTTPDLIAVMDDYAREQLVVAGCPERRIVVIGHPALDTLLRDGLAGRRETRAHWAVDDAATVVLFASEPVASDLGTQRGYDELHALTLLLHALGDSPIQLVIKPHPRERSEQLADLARRRKRTAIIETGLSGREAAAGADLVVGMTSILLLEAALGGRPVLSIQPGLREPWTDHFRTLITTVESVEGVRDWLQHAGTQAPLGHDALRARIRQAGFDERGTATDNVCRLLSRLSS